MANWNTDKKPGAAGEGRLTQREKIDILNEMLRLGRPLTREELKGLGVVSTDKGAVRAEQFMYNHLIPDNMARLGFNANGERVDADGNIIPKGQEGSGNVNDPNDERTDREKSFNSYWRDVHDFSSEGSTGYEYLSKLEEGHRQQAETDQWLADAVYQQQALQQGAIVKQITDQVRNERMARLRAGMSETQIANQDMQMMMANVNAVNEQMNQYAAGSLQSQAKAKNAQAMAFNDYLQWAAQGGQSAGAAYAAQVGDADYATRAALDSIYGVGNWGEVEYRKQYDTSTGQKGGK